MGTQIIKPQPELCIRRAEARRTQTVSAFIVIRRTSKARSLPGMDLLREGAQDAVPQTDRCGLGGPLLQRCQCSEIFKLLTKLQRPRPTSPQMMISKSSPHWPANKFLNWKGHADISSHNLTPQGLYVSGLHITICTRRS